VGAWGIIDAASGLRSGCRAASFHKELKSWISDASDDTLVTVIAPLLGAGGHTAYKAQQQFLSGVFGDACFFYVQQMLVAYRSKDRAMMVYNVRKSRTMERVDESDGKRRQTALSKLADSAWGATQLWQSKLLLDVDGPSEGFSRQGGAKSCSEEENEEGRVATSAKHVKK
jgi:hypothetical protein